MNYTYFANATNISSFPALLQFDNVVTGGMFGLMFLVAIWFISFVGLGLYPKDRAFLAANLITFIASFMMGAIGILDGRAWVVMLLMTVISVFLLKGDNQG